MAEKNETAKSTSETRTTTTTDVPKDDKVLETPTPNRDAITEETTEAKSEFRVWSAHGLKPNQIPDPKIRAAYIDYVRANP